MKFSDELIVSFIHLKEQDFETVRDYDKAILELERQLSAEHRRLIANYESCPYVFEAQGACRDFVVNMYFNGKWPRKDGRELRQVIEDVSSWLFAHLREENHWGSGKEPMYSDEVSELRIKLMDRAGICSVIEAAVDEETRELLLKRRAVAV